MSEDLLKELLVSVKGIQNDLAAVKENMAHRDDVMAVAATLEQITLDEVAVAKELATDKAETAYVLNKSITHGTEKRLTEKIEVLDQKMDNLELKVDNLEQKMDERFEKVIDSLSNISDIMRAWVYKQSEVDRDLQEIKRKLNGE